VQLCAETHEMPTPGVLHFATWGETQRVPGRRIARKTPDPRFGTSRAFKGLETRDTIGGCHDAQAPGL
jgi:hypothetical protein